MSRGQLQGVQKDALKVELQYHVDKKAMQYMNRLSDYLYIMARYEDYKENKMPEILNKNKELSQYEN